MAHWYILGNMKFLTVFCVVMLMSVIMDDPYIVDFGKDGGGKNWQVIVDGVMGGLSTGKTQFKDHSVVFSGEVSLANNGGFSAFRSAYGVFDFSAFDSVSIRYRAIGQTFAISMEKDERFYMPNYRFKLPTDGDKWKELSLPLSSFQEHRLGNPTGNPLDLSELNKFIRIGFITVEKSEGPFELEIDYLSFH